MNKYNIYVAGAGDYEIIADYFENSNGSIYFWNRNAEVDFGTCVATRTCRGVFPTSRTVIAKITNL